MAFLRVERKSSGQYLRIIESFRDADGKPSNRVLYSLGRVDDYTPDQLRKFGRKFIELSGTDVREILQGEIEELGRYNYGFVQVVTKALTALGLDSLFETIKRRHRLQLGLLAAVLLMLVERLNEPASKLRNYHQQTEYLGLPTVELHHLYRTLDYLARYQTQVQQTVFQRGRDLFNQQLDVVFYDVTTLYFESEKQIEGAIRQKGFSKDGKIGSTQILFGMLVDKNRAPVGYRIYRGDTYEGHTFADAVAKLKKLYAIDKVIVVADRGMLNKDNVGVLDGAEYEYILGERLRSLPEHLQKTLVDRANYQREWTYDHEGEAVTVRYCTCTYQGRTIIGTYSETRARKDAHERDERVRKAESLLATPAKLKSKAHYHYLSSDTEQSWRLDQERIARDARYDGYVAISTNSDISIPGALEQYRNLYKIEHTFRTFKSYLETRPVFHWTDRRIEGHICLCYISYAVLHYTLTRLETGGMKRSERDLRDAVQKMQVSLIQNGTNRFYLRSAMAENVAGIINRLGLRKLPNILPEKQMSAYL